MPITVVKVLSHIETLMARLEQMRRLIIGFTMFCAVLEGLGHVNFMVLVAGMAVALALILCSDFLLA